MNSELKLLVAISNLVLSTRKGAATATILADAAKIESSLCKAKVFDEVVSGYTKHAESFVLEGKPLPKRLKKFADDYNEFPSICKLAKKLAEKPDKPSTSSDEKIIAQDPKGFVVEELDAELEKGRAKGCGDPNCELDHSDAPLVFRSPCHPMFGLSASYQEGSIFLSCPLCGDPIAKIKVASEG